MRMNQLTFLKMTTKLKNKVSCIQQDRFTKLTLRPELEITLTHSNGNMYVTFPPNCVSFIITTKKDLQEVINIHENNENVGVKLKEFQNEIDKYIQSQLNEF